VSGLRLPKRKWEYWLMEYWLAEAEERKQIRESLDPFIGRIANRSTDPSEVEQRLSRMTRDGRRLLEHRGSARCDQLDGFYRA
jgi:hypothetical protein